MKSRGPALRRGICRIITILITDTHVPGEDIENVEPMEEGSGAKGIEGWKEQTKVASHLGEIVGLGA